MTTFTGACTMYNCKMNSEKMERENGFVALWRLCVCVHILRTSSILVKAFFFFILCPLRSPEKRREQSYSFFLNCWLLDYMDVCSVRHSVAFLFCFQKYCNRKKTDFFSLIHFFYFLFFCIGKPKQIVIGLSVRSHNAHVSCPMSNGLAGGIHKNEHSLF